MEKNKILERKIQMPDFTDKELKDAVKNSLICFYNKEGKDLVDRIGEDVRRGTNKHVAERSVVFRWALYLSNKLGLGIDSYSGIDSHSGLKIDLEYNRHGADIKKWNSGDISPDLIIHRRGDDDKNVLVVECKGWWNTDDNDLIRLKNFTTPKDGVNCQLLGYQLGIFVRFQKTIEETILELKGFKNGDEVEV